MAESGPGPSKKGRLIVVATPIGNLEDITLRALRVLGEADIVACEDTRVTLKLLNRYGLKKRMISYYGPRERGRIPEILSLLAAGKTVALVTDAGTPGLSDPGFPLIRECLKQGFDVVPIPGPSALATALSASGLPCNKVLFLGFPPPKRVGLKKFLEAVSSEEATLVFYVPARKIPEFLSISLDVLGDRRVVIAREMTKIHEEFRRSRLGVLADGAGSLELRGEATILIEGKQ